MPIIRIDQSKCIQCKLCIKDCLAYCYEWNEQENTIIFANNNRSCLECGHCISCCPQNAIVYENMGNSPFEFNDKEHPISIPSFESLNRMLQAKRSIRHYKSTPVQPEILAKVQLAMSYAPTGSNSRTMECKILSNPAEIQELSKAVMNTLIEAPTTTEEYREHLLHNQKIGKDSIFFKAPHVLIIHGDGEGDLINSSIAITYAMLAAESLGLGSCWIGLAYMALLVNKEARQSLAKIPNKIWGVFTLGYPDMKYVRNPPRHSLPLS